MDVTEFFWPFVRAAAVLEYDDLAATSPFTRMSDAVASGKPLLLEPHAGSVLLVRPSPPSLAMLMRKYQGQVSWNDRADAYEFADVNVLFKAIEDLIPRVDSASRAVFDACMMRISCWLDACTAADELVRKVVM